MKKPFITLLPLFLILVLENNTSYAQRDLKTIRTDSKTEMEKQKRLAEVKKNNGKWTKDYSDYKFILIAIGREFSEWQKKGEFEKTEEWNERLMDSSSFFFELCCEQIIADYIRCKIKFEGHPNIYSSTNEYRYLRFSSDLEKEKWCKWYNEKDLSPGGPEYIVRPLNTIYISDYNPDNESFVIHISYRNIRFGYWLTEDEIETFFRHNLNYKIKIPITEAQHFKSKMNDTIFLRHCFIIPLESSNYSFVRHNILPKKIIFNNLEYRDIKGDKYCGFYCYRCKYKADYWGTNEYHYFANQHEVEGCYDVYKSIRQRSKLILGRCYSEEDSMKILNPWGRSKQVINVLENIDSKSIKDVIIYFDDLGLDNPYLKGSCYNYTKQQFIPNPATAKLIAEQEAKLQKLKEEQELQRKNDSIFQMADNTLQQAVSDFNTKLGQLPYDYDNHKLSLSIPKSLYGNEQEINVTLNSLLDSVKTRTIELSKRYTADSISFAQHNETLQQSVNNYNMRLRKMPYDYLENKLSMYLPKNLYGNEQEINVTLHSLRDSIKTRTTELMNRYTADSISFAQHNETLQAMVSDANAQLLAYPYNLKQQTPIKDTLPYSLFGKKEELDRAINSKHSFLAERVEEFKKLMYNDARKNSPDRFAEIYFAQNPQQKHRADSVYRECRCYYQNRLSFDMAFINDYLGEICDCREKKYREVKGLYQSREEFDSAYNHPKNEFEQEVADRYRKKADIRQLAEELASLKQLNLKKAESSSKPQIQDLVNHVSRHRNSYYYNEAIDLIFAYNDKLAKEWEKNGEYFQSKAEMYEFWVGDEYDKVLKERKRK